MAAYCRSFCRWYIFPFFLHPFLLFFAFSSLSLFNAHHRYYLYMGCQSAYGACTAAEIGSTPDPGMRASACRSSHRRPHPTLHWDSAARSPRRLWSAEPKDTCRSCIPPLAADSAIAFPVPHNYRHATRLRQRTTRSAKLLGFHWWGQL